MSDTREDFSLLMQRVRTGCPDAARLVFARYNKHIQRIVRRKLHHRMRPQYDSLDFTQSVWGSFFAVPADRFTFATEQELIGFLSQLAYNKVVEVVRQRFQTQKRNIRAEVPIARGEDDRETDPPTRQPTPSQFAMANERWEQLLLGQSDKHRRILEMLRDGHSHKEIANQLGLHPKMIQRLVLKLTQRVSQP